MNFEFFSKDFRKVLKYQISLKSVQCEPSCCVGTDGRTDGSTYMTKPITAFRKFANASKKNACDVMTLAELVAALKPECRDSSIETLYEHCVTGAHRKLIFYTFPTISTNNMADPRNCDKGQIV